MTINIEPDTARVSTVVRVGTYSPSSRGPLGTSTWESERVWRVSGPSDQRVREQITVHYQEMTTAIIPAATITANGVTVPVYEADLVALQMMDVTLADVPPQHLELLNRRKPDGFLISSTAGRRGGSLSYTGGLNARVDNRATRDYNESRMITITHGAIWHHKEQMTDVCPTVFHEIGHVMTHRGEINYGPFADDHAERLAGGTASRNPGALEALCNCYMYFLCYASRNAGAREFGTGSGDQNNAAARAALRRTPAFGRMLRGSVWTLRFTERT